MEKGLKLKNQKVFGAISYVCRSFSGKTGRGRALKLPKGALVASAMQQIKTTEKPQEFLVFKIQLLEKYVHRFFINNPLLTLALNIV